MAANTMNATDYRIIRHALATVWLVTGLVVLFVYPKEESMQLLSRVSLTGFAADAALYLGALLDIVMGVLTLTMVRRWLWQAQMLLIVGYTIIISIWLPEFWIHPFGPLLKNLPILALLWLLIRQRDVT
jgi:uncharacterized membrane protein YoaK (UPF0700 family)